MIRCEQVKCGFYLAGGCESCSNCKAKPYNIDENCDMCIDCEQEEGILRWGEKSNKIKNKIMLRKVV